LLQDDPTDPQSSDADDMLEIVCTICLSLIATLYK